jgi:hypothetical protein
MEYPLSNCSTVAAVARQLGKYMQFVNLFRNTVDLQGVPTSLGAVLNRLTAVMAMDNTEPPLKITP